ncbi:hypothetical protein CPB85DRAFT_921559 [Mucidula mucida]|nr:hypothetical protein CPB85DRAFT_921559 [Mucidula mucida]
MPAVENIPHPSRPAGKRYYRRAKGSSRSTDSSPRSRASDDLPATTSRGKGATILTGHDDACAAQIIMALIHDCFIVINQAQRGAPLDSAFSLRSRLLSLYIVEEDVSALKMAVGMDATKRLFELRDRTLFCGKNERGRMAVDRGCEESRELQEIIRSVLVEPPLNNDNLWQIVLEETISTVESCQQQQSMSATISLP